MLRENTAPALAEALSRMADDPDPQVRFQLALSLSQWNDPRAGQAPRPGDPPRRGRSLDPRRRAQLGAGPPRAAA